jgi:hypothetical protein
VGRGIAIVIRKIFPVTTSAAATAAPSNATAATAIAAAAAAASAHKIRVSAFHVQQQRRRHLMTGRGPTAAGDSTATAIFSCNEVLLMLFSNHLHQASSFRLVVLITEGEVADAATAAAAAAAVAASPST